MSLGLEKRAGRRIPINCPVQIMLPDGREFHGLVLDLSVDGVRFDCPVELVPAQEAEIRMLPHVTSPIPPLRAVIEVLRCDPAEAPGKFEIAAALRVIK